MTNHLSYSNVITRRHLHVDGVVQGVGFRPFIYNLALRNELTGWVFNSSSGVDIEIQGQSTVLDVFEKTVINDAPPLARIDHMSTEAIPTIDGESSFIIRHSTADSGVSLISPDVATCPDCIREVFDPADRRYRYPFTNCTNCGPRYTIIQSMPYDRPATTMRAFPMCSTCQHEYDDPAERRFHAQPNACPDCGPQVTLNGPDEILVHATGQDEVARAASLLKAGYIVAIKGLGGFHLACDATNHEAVARLRERKSRPDKPFAVMIASATDVSDHCHLLSEEAALLEGISAPIVLLYRRTDSAIAINVAPDNPMLGVMLPYTPLHHILLRDMGRPLVMTSGNLSNMPIIIDNDEALEQLSAVADAFLLHNRNIHTRCDDAIWWVDQLAGATDPVRQPLRRSRGDAPYPVRLIWETRQPIIGTGAEMKNTLCLLRGSDAFLSQHIGQLDSLESLASYRHTLDHLSEMFKISPRIIAHDLHPNYLTTRLAHDLSDERGLERIAVQHHHAHIAACLAEHGYQEQVIGIALDGTGYGPDGHIWGGEILIADVREYERVAYLEYLPLPGGETAIRRPYRIAWGYLLATLGYIPDLPTLSSFPEKEQEIVIRQVERGLNTPLTSSCGRLFDMVSALLGICPVTTFEAQAAIALELHARQVDPSSVKPLPYEIDNENVIRIQPMLSALVNLIQQGEPVEQLAAAFHLTIAHMMTDAARNMQDQYGLSTVALSGGVFQNRLMLRLMRNHLREGGFHVLTHQQVPANDGGLSLGQTVIALHRGE